MPLPMSEMETTAVTEPNWPEQVPPTNIQVELRLKVLLHAQTEVGQVQHDDVCQHFP